MADGDEHAFHRDRLPLAGPAVADHDAVDLALRRVVMSSTSAFHSNAIFGFANALSCMIFDARSVSRRWMTVTCDANRVRKIASSIAESPPPTTAIGLPRKK